MLQIDSGLNNVLHCCALHCVTENWPARICWPPAMALTPTHTSNIRQKHVKHYTKQLDCVSICVTQWFQWVEIKFHLCLVSRIRTTKIICSINVNVKIVVARSIRRYCGNEHGILWRFRSGLFGRVSDDCSVSCHVSRLVVGRVATRVARCCQTVAGRTHSIASIGRHRRQIETLESMSVVLLQKQNCY